MIANWFTDLILLKPMPMLIPILVRGYVPWSCGSGVYPGTTGSYIVPAVPSPRTTVKFKLSSEDGREPRLSGGPLGESSGAGGPARDLLRVSMRMALMPVSHRAYCRYGQTSTVNAYTVTPKSTPDTVSYGQSVYGLHGQLARSLRSRTVAHTACTVARTVSTVGRTVYTVSCYTVTQKGINRAAE